MKFRILSLITIYNIACLAFMSLPVISVAQQFSSPTQTLHMDEEGVTMTFPKTWSVAPKDFANAYELINVPEEEQARAVSTDTALGAARIMIFAERRTDHAEAVHRLVEIAEEEESPSTFLNIGGWPALQRRYLAPLEQTSVQPTEESDNSKKNTELSLRITTAIAAGDLLVRLEGSLPPGASPDVAKAVEAIGRSLHFATTGDLGQTDREVKELQGGVSDEGSVSEGSSFLAPSLEAADPSAESAGGATSGDTFKAEDLSEMEASLGQTLLVNNGAGVDSEIEIAVSTDGQNIVIGNNALDFSFSNDGGQNFTTSAVNPGFPANGDPSLAIGRLGDFFFAFIGFPNGSPAARNVRGCSTGIAVSIDNGQNFNFRNHAALCPLAGRDMCFPDQEHIAADHRVAVAAPNVLSQVYTVWRNLTPSGRLPANCGQIDRGSVTPSITCSSDSGFNWMARRAIDARGRDFPRVTVGQDGNVYVVYRSGNNIMLNKYSSCNTGLVQQRGFPRRVFGLPLISADVSCPIPGLDRCETRRSARRSPSLTSHMVAVNDRNPNHIYVAYAFRTSSRNEDILVQDSTDGGLTWPARRRVRANTRSDARRYMPWICSQDGAAFVSWYDRRFATRAQNDLTDFFGTSAFLDRNGNLQAGAEFRISEVSDPNCCAGDPLCMNGWPAAPRAQRDSESCSVQPQFAGVCSRNPARRCDFRNNGRLSGCPRGEGSCVTGRGAPKYGDYNGNACSPGRFYTAWASATSPPGIVPSNDINVFFNVRNTRTADLAVAKTDTPDPMNVGQNLTYTITVTNNGPEDAPVVTLTDNLPAGVNLNSVTPSQGTCTGTRTVNCQLGNLANGASAIITIVVVSTTPGIITNTVNVTGAVNDRNLGNNAATQDTTVQRLIPSADLAVAKTDDPDPVLQGNNLTYTATVTNNGPDEAPVVTLADNLPAGVNFVSASPSQGTCSGGTGGAPINCQLGNIANGANVTATIVVVPTTRGIITNEVIVSSTASDGNLGNNIATQNTMVQELIP